MALHIRSSSVDRLARKVAKRTGETLTAAIETALSERLERLENVDQADEDALLRDLRAITRRVSPALKKSKKTARELVDELYDEDGLPK
jgi:antitoxin VapB